MNEDDVKCNLKNSTSIDDENNVNSTSRDDEKTAKTTSRESGKCPSRCDLQNPHRLKDDETFQNKHDLSDCSNAFAPMPMNDMRLDEWFHQEHIEPLDDGARKWWTNISTLKNFCSLQKTETNLKQVTEVISNHMLNTKSQKIMTSFNLFFKDKLLEAISPFETLFDENLGFHAGKPLHFRAMNDHN